MPSSLAVSLSIGRIGHSLGSLLVLLYVEWGAWELQDFVAIFFIDITRDRIHGMEDVTITK
jgi:hypothetical protein